MLLPSKKYVESRFQKLSADNKGSVAIEFAFCALPFLALLFAIIEISMVLLFSIILDGAVLDAARKIRTGEAFESGDAAGTFATKLCDSLFGVIDCDKVSYHVTVFPDFSSITFAPMYDEDGEPIPSYFEDSVAGDIVVVRASYTWNILTPFLAPFLGRDNFGLVATTVFRSEPYQGAI
ncbi:MAG: TadE/TadG family type IV pilus assembly protein [Alphaproteobacteria bacterium]